MELERWAELSEAICAVAAGCKRHLKDRYSTGLIVRVYLWAALHERPICWATLAGNWTGSTCPAVLPDQSTMSRRTRREDFMAFLKRLGQRLNGRTKPALMKLMDGKALELPNHSSDRDATWGRGVSRLSLGYKLHAICSGHPMPDAFVITSLNVCEKKMAARMLPRLGGGGYAAADAHFDASWLYDLAHHHGHQ